MNANKQIRGSQGGKYRAATFLDRTDAPTSWEVESRPRRSKVFFAANVFPGGLDNNSCTDLTVSGPMDGRVLEPEFSRTGPRV